MFLASDLAREVLLALTGPRNYDDAAPGYDRAARSRLRRVLVDELREAHEQPLHLPEPRDDRLRAIARMLHENPADNTSLAELGRTIGASARTLSRLFRDELGMTFYEWRTQLRIYHALVLLADGHDTTQSPTPAAGPTPAASSRPSPTSSAPPRAATGLGTCQDDWMLSDAVPACGPPVVMAASRAGVWVRLPAGRPVPWRHGPPVRGCPAGW